MQARYVALALALFTVPLAGCVSDEPTPEDEAGLAWSFTDTEGVDHSHETAAGSPTVVFFIATWCPSCQEKASEVRAVHEAYQAEGVDVFTLTVDTEERHEDLEAWKQEHEQPWPHGVDEDVQTARTMGVTQTSNVVVLDGDNRIEHHWGYGQYSEEAISNVLEGLLAG